MASGAWPKDQLAPSDASPASDAIQVFFVSSSVRFAIESVAEPDVPETP